MKFNELIEQRVKEGNYDDGMQPIDLTTNPSLKALMNRHSQLYYQEDTTSDEEMAEQDAIEQHALEKFGQRGLDSLHNATQANFWGRKDGRGSGGHRTSNLGIAGAPTGNFRTTKAGKMHSQDVKMMKNKIADRLGRHPEPELPEGAVSEVRGDGDRHMNDPLDDENIFTGRPGVSKRALARLKALLTVRLFAEDELRMMHLYDVVQDKQLFDIINYAKRHAPPKTDLRNYQPFSSRIQTLIARAEKKLNLNQRQEQGVAEGLGKDIKRLATGKDVKSRAGQEIAKSQDASMKGDTKTSKKHFDRYDKLDKLANKEQGVAEGRYDNRDAYQRDYDSSVGGMTPRDSYAYSQDGGVNDERHDLDTPRPTIYGLKINGKIYKKDGNTVTFFTRERASAARNSILAKRPELEITLVQRPQD